MTFTPLTNPTYISRVVYNKNPNKNLLVSGKNTAPKMFNNANEASKHRNVFGPKEVWSNIAEIPSTWIDNTKDEPQNKVKIYDKYSPIFNVGMTTYTKPSTPLLGRIEAETPTNFTGITIKKIELNEAVMAGKPENGYFIISMMGRTGQTHTEDVNDSCRLLTFPSTNAGINSGYNKLFIVTDAYLPVSTIEWGKVLEVNSLQTAPSVSATNDDQYAKKFCRPADISTPRASLFAWNEIQTVKWTIDLHIPHIYFA